MGAIDVPMDFRGPTMPSLTSIIAGNGFIDAQTIGTAVRKLSRDLNAWKERGTYAEVLQKLKLLWHVLIRFGNSDCRQDGCGLDR